MNSLFIFALEAQLLEKISLALQVNHSGVDVAPDEVEAAVVLVVPAPARRLVAVRHVGTELFAVAALCARLAFAHEQGHHTWRRRCQAQALYRNKGQRLTEHG